MNILFDSVHDFLYTGLGISIGLLIYHICCMIKSKSKGGF